MGLGWRSGQGTVLLSDSPRIDSQWCHWIFQWHTFFQPYHGPGVDSAPSENVYQEHFLGVRAASAWGWWPHHLHVPNVMKIWEPKPPWTLWATLGLLYLFITTKYNQWQYALASKTALSQQSLCGQQLANNILKN